MGEDFVSSSLHFSSIYSFQSSSPVTDFLPLTAMLYIGHLILLNLFTSYPQDSMLTLLFFFYYAGTALSDTKERTDAKIKNLLP